MSPKVSEARAKYRVRGTPVAEKSRGHPRDASSAATNSADELRYGLTEIKTSIEGLAQRLSEIEARMIQILETQELFNAMLKTAREASDDDLAWLRLAERSFSFWDNEEDAIYDSL